MTSSTLRSLIVDDEPLARSRLRRLLADEEGVEVVGEAATAAEAIAAVVEQSPDVVFLDVQMPEGDGFAFLEGLPAGATPAIVFVTAHDEHAVRAFEVHAVDYLLKPFDQERLAMAVARARIAVDRGEGEIDGRLAAVLRELKGDELYATRFVVKSTGRMILIRAEDVDWIEAAGNYARLRIGKESHLLRETMNSLEGRLDPKRFVRIHRSTMVNLDRVKELNHIFHGDYSVMLRDGTRLTLSRGYREAFERRVAGSGHALSLE